MGDHYGFSLTTFSPSGKLMQIEYALNAVKNGQPSVGLRATNGVVLATENKASILNEEQPKIEKISEHIGCVYSGMGPDFRQEESPCLEVDSLSRIESVGNKSRQLRSNSREESPQDRDGVRDDVRRRDPDDAAGVEAGGGDARVHPIRRCAPVRCLAAGGRLRPRQAPNPVPVRPLGAYFAWKATALGKSDVNAKTFLEKRFNETLELDDGIHTALLTLRESFDVGMTEDNVEIAICNDQGFKRLTKQQIKDHLSSL
ncbi:hypothetical protein L596_017198 [Steinernema carpocapsae]|uniref:Proteasome subunit alpha type n=1 Tax=Steinernema carpocapsae TaxID=34508 RepID=A0A4U5N1A6_STECR|nr:hypothetical protein L596_017198 [Steinernema carpocapsae]